MTRKGAPDIAPTCCDPERLEAMKALYNAGCNLVGVGEMFDLDPRSVYSYFKRHGVPMRGARDWRRIPNYHAKMIARQLGE